MNTKAKLGWILIATGTLFLLCGLFVTMFATLNSGKSGSLGAEIGDPSFWVMIANQVMAFTLELLNVDWNPFRMGVFLIVVGTVFDGAGAYSLITDKPTRRRRR